MLKNSKKKQKTHHLNKMNEFQVDEHQPNEIELSLVQGISTFWKEKTFTDIEIHCGQDGKTIKAHRLVLAALSPLLRNAFESVPFADTDVVVIVPDVDSILLLALLDTIYNGCDDGVLIPSELQFLNIGAPFSTDNKTDTCMSKCDRSIGNEDSALKSFGLNSKLNHVVVDGAQGLPVTKGIVRKVYWKYFANAEIKTEDGKELENKLNSGREVTVSFC